jgi:hypothetical protein
MTGETDPIARILRVAGPRPEVPEERAARVRTAVHARWRAEVAGAGAQAAPAPAAATPAVAARRWVPQRTAFWAAGLAAAAVLVVVLGRAWRSPAVPTPSPVPTPSMATLVRSVGTVDAPGGAALAPGAILASGAAIETGADGRAALLLAGDGASVRLDSGTRLTLLPGPVVVLDAGAVYIDSGRLQAGAGTLEVRTGLGIVRDIGTRFEVRLRGGDLLVSVREGQASLVHSERSFAATAGTQLRVDADGAVETHPVAVQGTDWDWVMAIAPGFDLEGRTLGQYLDWLAGETGWRVEFEDAAIGRSTAGIVLHGSVAGLRPDETPAAVLPTCGLGHRLAGGTLFIGRPGGGAGKPS